MSSTFAVLHCATLCFSASGVLPAVQLTRKLVSTLETIERLPVLSYELPGTFSGLQVRRLHYPTITVVLVHSASFVWCMGLFPVSAH